MTYNYKDVDYYLRCYNKIKLELNLFLVANITNDKSEILSKKTGRETESSLISKLDDVNYKKNKYALDCIDKLYKDMDSETYKIMRYRYVDRLSYDHIALKVYTSKMTVRRRIKKEKEKLLKILRKIEHFEHF